MKVSLGDIRMKIGVDLDGCLADYIGPFLDHYNHSRKTSFTKGDVTSHTLWECLSGTREEVLGDIQNFYTSAQFRELPVVFGSRDVVRELSREHELIVITFRPNHVSHVDVSELTRRWVYGHHPDRFADVVLTGGYEGKKSKAEICLELGVDCIIEDSVENAIDCASNGIPSTLLDYPWNRNDKLPKNVRRVDNWGGVIRAVQEFEDGK